MSPPDFDLKALNFYLERELPGYGEVSDLRPAGSGQSNPTYILRTKMGSELVLRRKPFGKLLPSAHAIDREFRVMKALAKTTVPVPAMLSYCHDADLIGSEFFLMCHVEGQAYMDPRLKDFGSDQRRDVFVNMAESLASLHSVNIASVGLQDYGAQGLYFERNLARWTKQYRASETKYQPQIEELLQWLHANVPSSQSEITLVHGDYRLDNLLIDPQIGRINAIVDWELSTTGHPMSDLGAVFMQWSLPPGFEGRGLQGVDRASLGIPSDQEFANFYTAARGGADLSDLRFSLPFAFFRMAAILQGVVKRGLDGNAADPAGAAKMESYVPLFASGGLLAAKNTLGFC